MKDESPVSDPVQDMVVVDPRMLAVIEEARKVAQHNASVLITGETGVGKELIARIIHENSPRGTKPWVDINCSALPEHLVESELFGYEKGAFSGAESTKPGLFEMASGGTLFLDEMGDLDPKIQVKLLRVLDGSPYYRLGGRRKVAVDVRVIAATNRDLNTCVREGSFRGDLYHRISEVHLEIPPLRERPQDIIALAQHFLAKTHPGASFTPEALHCLAEHEWRGNVRELRNLVLKLAIQGCETVIGRTQVLAHLELVHHDALRSSDSAAGIARMAEIERRMIIRALAMTKGNQTLAAEQLGIPRRTFCRKLNELQIAVERRRKRSPSDARLPVDYRKELHVPVSITTASGHCFGASTMNLSEGGLGLRKVQPPVKAGEHLTIAFTLPGSNSTLRLQGVVAWCQQDGMAGIRFLGTSPGDAATLAAWIHGTRQPALANLPGCPCDSSQGTPVSVA